MPFFETRVCLCMDIDECIVTPQPYIEKMSNPRRVDGL
jgi:hypothetical protein